MCEKINLKFGRRLRSPRGVKVLRRKRITRRMEKKPKTKRKWRVEHAHDDSEFVQNFRIFRYFFQRNGCGCGNFRHFFRVGIPSLVSIFNYEIRVARIAKTPGNFDSRKLLAVVQDLGFGFKIGVYNPKAVQVVERKKRRQKTCTKRLFTVGEKKCVFRRKLKFLGPLVPIFRPANG